MFSEFIRSKVQERYGKLISCSSDCLHLALHIIKRTDLKISEATIIGLFGIQSNRKEPSLYTLEVCAKYLGYDSSAQLRREFNRIKFAELDQIEFKEHLQYTCTCVSV